MHPEIEKLIKLAVADGEITEKERAVIMRKAEKLGEDIDEVEMILEGELALLIKEQKSESQNQLKSNKEGVLKKCPSCGAPVDSFSTKCAECGHEYQEKNATHSIRDLFDLLIKAEETERNRPRPKVNWLIAGQENLNFENSIATRLANIINNYPVPITKTDILEFLSQSMPKCKKLSTFGPSATVSNLSHNTLADAWKNKCKEIIMKARFSMKDDKKTLEEIEGYAKQLGIK